MRSRQENSLGVCSPEHLYTHCMKEIRENRESQDLGALEASEEECELCGTKMFGLHCKLVCPNCGYRRDCSDP